MITIFIFVAFISCSQLQQSMSAVKYHWLGNISNLLDNYERFHNSFSDFLFFTSHFQRGQSDAQWSTSLYLMPLFLFCDVLGGLSIKTICIFSVTSSLLALIVFYCWIRSFWGRQVAFYSVILLGFSSIFQEIARSGDFIAFSFLLAVIWIFFFFRLIRSGGTSIYYFCFGLLTGVMVCFYWILKGFAIVALGYMFSLKKQRKMLGIGLYLLGIGIVVMPGVFILFNNHISFFPSDKENIHSFKEFLSNWHVFIQHIFGNNLILEPYIKDTFHACFWNPLLVWPLLVGVISAFLKCRYKRDNFWLFILVFFIFFPPMMFYFYSEARRSLFYIIPSYCFIGLGIVEILYWVKNFKNVALKVTVNFLCLVMICFVVYSEMNILQEKIIINKRDFGLLKFAESIQKMHLNGDLYYLESSFRVGYISLGWGSRESSVFRVAMMDNGKTSFNISNGYLSTELPFKGGMYYVVLSPFIPLSDYREWCSRNNLRSSLIFQSNFEDVPRKHPFILYFVSSY